VFLSRTDFIRKQKSLIGRGADVDTFGKINNRSGFLFREYSPTVTIPGHISKTTFTDPSQERKPVYASQPRHLAGFVEPLASDLPRHFANYMQLYARRHQNLLLQRFRGWKNSGSTKDNTTIRGMADLVEG
jgi:hypothetical protein